MKKPLLLTGFMATGKSTIGRRVAELSGTSFIDLDALIEQQQGKRVSEIFQTLGESGFRKLEREAFTKVLDQQQTAVVALGGGTLLERQTRLMALERATVISLTANRDTILKRASQTVGARPLLTSPEQIELLLELRERAYAEAHARLDSSELSVEQAARACITIWHTDPIAVAAGLNSYRVEVGDGISAGQLPPLIQGASSCVWISDNNVVHHHGAGMRQLVSAASARSLEICLPAGEEHKHLQTLDSIWRRALDFAADRKAIFIGFGGGVVTDVTGFAAAAWLRGVPWVSVPTTLLAMVDAAVGGKTAVDLVAAKNAIGAFWQPCRVVCDVAFLRTEPERGFVSALAEVVKSALIGDGELFELLENESAAVLARDPAVITEIVRRSVRVKANIVSRDERESGLRAVLNLGHTLGHALEAYAGFGHLTHGEAVSLGLVAALKLGQHWGETPAHVAERTMTLLSRLNLPADLSKHSLAAAAELIGHDKKRAGSSVSFVVAREVGNVGLRKVGLDELAGLARQL